MDSLRIALPEWAQLPDIGLYMDQVITLMERTFGGELSEREITRSMVNNYVKVGLMKRPAGKRYDREHLAQLLMIAVLKQALSLEAIAQLLQLLCAEGVCAGYDSFRLRMEAFQERLSRGGAPMQEAPAREQAIDLGIAAALCTILARRQLQEAAQADGAQEKI